MRDLRNALRTMRRSPGFAVVAVVMLALGIGVNAAVFTLTNTVLFKGFRLVEGNERIVYIGAQKDGRGCCASYPDFLDWREQTTSFVDMGAVADLKVTFSDTGRFSEAYSATQISANAFRLLGQTPILGRDFLPADDDPGAARVAILAYGFWERRYGRDPSVVGRTVRINGEPATVIGVMAQGFSFPQNQDLWVPLVPTPDLLQRDNRSLWFAFGRMADGATRASAAAELESIGGRLARAYPGTNGGWVPRPLTFSEFFVSRDAATTYGALWGAVGFVLLIACANLANLLLARAMGRSREMSVRLALGASRWRIVRQLLVESVLLSAAGGVLGWWIAKWGVRAYALAANPPTRAWSDNLLDYTMDGRVLAYLVAISVGAGLLFGLVPALKLSALDVNRALRDGSRGASGGGRGKHLSALLVAGEMALAVVLLAGAGVMLRSFLNLSTADLGVRTANIVTMMMNLPPDRYPDGAAQQSFYDRFTRRLDAIPGVESSAIASSVPAGGARRTPYELGGAAPVDAQRRPTVGALTVSTGYFRTLSVTVRAGRDFTDFDGPSGPPAVIVNERFASTYWPGDNPLGKRVRLFDGDGPGAWRTVVGVVSNVVQDVTRQEIEPLVYVPYRQNPAQDVWVVVRARVPAATLGTAFQREIAALDADLPIWVGPFTLEERLAGMGNYWNTGNDAVLLLIFAALALLLASAGLYAVVAHSVGQRTQEIGIRLAIGATTRDVFALVCRQGLLPAGLGLVIGLVASLAVNRILQSQLVQVAPADPLTLVVASLVLGSCATLGCLIPARRAMAVDPIVVLKP